MDKCQNEPRVVYPDAAGMPEATRLVDRVQRLENLLQEAAEMLETHAGAINRVGARLSRVETHVGLPGSDVE